MTTVRLPSRARAVLRHTASVEDHDMAQHEPQVPAGPSAELADLYAAIMIAVPLALFLKWLWP
jgi:hypothetical protein